MLDFCSMMIRAGAACRDSTAQLCDMNDGSRMHAQLVFADESTGVVSWVFRPAEVSQAQVPGDAARRGARVDRIICSPASENPPFETSVCWTTVIEETAPALRCATQSRLGVRRELLVACGLGVRPKVAARAVAIKQGNV